MYNLTKMALYDVAKLVNNNNTTGPTGDPIIRLELLYLSSAIEFASDEDNQMLRTELAIRTIINTAYPREKRYHAGNGKPRLYTPEIYSVENVLGVTSCHVYLRLERAYAQGLIEELPLWSQCQLHFKANMAADLKDPQMVDYAQGLLRPRSTSSDCFALLKVSIHHIGYLFNHVIAAPKAFPLLLCCDRALGDSPILLFLLLLLIDIPVDVIAATVEQLQESLLSSKVWQIGQGDQEAKLQQRVDSTHWSLGVKELLDEHYGSTAAYFDAAGVTASAKETIKGSLLESSFPHSEVLIDLGLDEKATSG